MDKFFRKVKEKVMSPRNPTGNPDATKGNVKVIQIPPNLPTASEIKIELNPKLAHRGLSPQTLKAMGNLVQVALSPTAPTGMSDYRFDHLKDMFDDKGTFSIDQPHFLIRSDTRSWNQIYDDGGFEAKGGNIDLDAHIGYETGQSAYVAASKVRQVYVSASSSNAWLYVYRTHVVIETGNAAQDELAALGKVPLQDIFLFRHNLTPDRIYENLDFDLAGLDMTPQLRAACIALLRG